MFDETKKYKLNGHFFFKKGDKLSEVSKEVPNEPGVYYILRLVNGRVDLVYIGKAGTVTQNCEFKEQGLKSRINNKQEDIKRQDFFYNKMISENIDGLDIYWFVTKTKDKQNNDLPSYVEGVLVQRFYEDQGHLPLWNKAF
ncbi:MAG: hypothetical protein U5L45_03385 [Saprospiraceae bacterium]|nr:hypothetical protein [Saprospiraceae bacterium]